jgi:hypothetical protein
MPVCDNRAVDCNRDVCLYTPLWWGLPGLTIGRLAKVRFLCSGNWNNDRGAWHCRSRVRCLSEKTWAAWLLLGLAVLDIIARFAWGKRDIPLMPLILLFLSLSAGISLRQEAVRA